MEPYEREFLLSRILFGSIMIDVNKDLTICIHPPTIEQNFFAQHVFKRVYDESLLSGVFTRKEMLGLMKEQEVWSEEKEKALEKNQKKIEDLKLKLYENFLKPSTREGIRREIRQTEKDQVKLHGEKHQNDHLDCQGIATYSRLNWVVENTTTHKDGTPYEFDEISINGILRLKSEQAIEVDQYREIARTDPWRSIWINAEKDTGKAFQRIAAELSEEQQQLVSWSRLYDNVGEAHESPSDKIIQDDDALDGWLIKQSREREKEQSKIKQDGLESKHQNADEVFVLTSSREEAEEVHNMNDDYGEYVRASRRKELSESKKPIAYHNFNDVKIRAMNEASAKFGG